MRYLRTKWILKVEVKKCERASAASEIGVDNNDALKQSHLILIERACLVIQLTRWNQSFNHSWYWSVKRAQRGKFSVTPLMPWNPSTYHTRSTHQCNQRRPHSLRSLDRWGSIMIGRWVSTHQWDHWWPRSTILCFNLERRRSLSHTHEFLRKELFCHASTLFCFCFTGVCVILRTLFDCTF